MNSQEIRETYLSFFEERGHLRVPSASLVPPPEDASTLLTVAGMQPFKPYFRGEKPPNPRLASCQKCFRTPDIEQVGNTRRHLTFFEMLGNWSFGDYFKRESIAWGYELSVDGFGLDPERIWVSVFGGDDELVLGPDEESVEVWREAGIPDERIVFLPRSENFWQAGAIGPCGPCSELYLDIGEEFGSPDDRPGDDTDRFVEYWNHVFMSYELQEDGSVTPLPKNNIDTGLGLERMAGLLQGVGSVFETDAFRPLIELAEESTGRKYGQDPETTRAMRIIADHSRGMTFLIADGVVPSNEERGYVLRRVMRRAIQQGRVLGLDEPWLSRFTDRTIEMMASAYPELASQQATIERWVNEEESAFGRTLERGSALLDELVAGAKEQNTSWIEAADAFRLHDTYGFPYEVTRELLREQGLSVDDAGFDELMEQQRERARSGASRAGPERHEFVTAFISGAPESRFVGYETLEATTAVTAVRVLEGSDPEGGEALVKLEDSPFYAEGGGQVADSGVIRWNGVEAAVVDVYRVGDDQALRISVDRGAPGEGVRIEAEVERRARHATMRNHTATHLLHAVLRVQLGEHVHQAGSAVRPDKLRFDFAHGEPIADSQLEEIEAAVNESIKASLPVRWMQMSRAEAERLGAMALFGEKYGEWVRVVEIASVSRELCGGTHVANTAEVGLFSIISEGSSAANVRRIEAVTGPAAIDLDVDRRRQLDRIGALLGSSREPLAAAERAAQRLEELERGVREAGKAKAGERAAELERSSTDLGGIAVVVGEGDGADQRELLALAARVRDRLGSSAVVVGGTEAGRVAIVAAFADPAIERGLHAAEIVSDAAKLIGGGGGGREGVAQAGGGDPERLSEALESARGAIERKLAE